MCERTARIQTKVDWKMTENNECSSQILQSKAYCVDIQDRELENVVYQKHQIEKFKSKFFT